MPWQLFLGIFSRLSPGILLTGARLTLAQTNECHTKAWDNNESNMKRPMVGKEKASDEGHPEGTELRKDFQVR